MSKQSLLISAPYPSRSGYGAHSRDICRCLIESDEYDIQLIPLNWGNCPCNGLKEDDPIHQRMAELTFKGAIKEQPDIFVHITIPNEFKPYGKSNIGITAGIETDRVSMKWIQAANIMTAMIVPSMHSRNAHANVTYDMKQGPDGPVINQIKNYKPIEVLFEGVDTNIFKFYDTDKSDKSEELSKVYDIPEEFAFLYVGHWLQGNFREDRKDTGGLIYNFLSAFNYMKGQVALVLKVSGAGFSLLDLEEIKDKINKIKDNLPDREMQPNVYIVHGDLTDSEMNELYNINKIKAMVTCTHGEGYGRPLAEFAAATGKPVLATGWSGQLDFLNHDDCLLFNYNIKPVADSVVWEDIIIKGSNWAYVDDADVVNKLKKCFYKYEDLLPGAKRIQNRIVNSMSLSNMKDRLLMIIDKYRPATKSNIILPGKIDLSKLKKMI